MARISTLQGVKFHFLIFPEKKEATTVLRQLPERGQIPLLQDHFFGFHAIVRFNPDKIDSFF